jgi:ABC-2 type transport system permease protein
MSDDYSVYFTGQPRPAVSGIINYIVEMQDTLIDLGTLIGVISKDSRMTILWSQLIFLPSTMIGGIMIPTGALPDSLRGISCLLPTSWARQIFDLSLGGTPSAAIIWPIAILLSGGLLCFFMASYLFSWDNQVRDKRRNPLSALLVLVLFIAGALFAG